MRSFRDRGGEAMLKALPFIQVPGGWGSMTEEQRKLWRADFADFVAHLATFGLRVEDDQTPHGPDVGGGDARTEHA